MKHQVLVAVGKLFTQKWVREQRNPKIAEFNESAEYCLSDKKNAFWGHFVTSTIFLLGIMLIVAESILGGLAIIMLGFSITLCIMMCMSPGETSKGVSKDWAILRKKLIKHNVLREVTKQVEKEKLPFISDDNIRKLLVLSLDKNMQSLQRALRNAQKEGFPKKESHIQKQIDEFEKLPTALGISMTFDHERTPSRVPVVRVPLTRAM